MNCERIEELLPAYADGDIAGEDKSRVDEHVAQCAACRESLAFYTHLEQSLIERRSLRPSAAVAARRTVRRLGLKKRWGFAESLYSWPGAIGAGFAAFAVLWFLGDRVLEAEGLALRFEMLVDRWLRGIDALAMASEFTLPAVSIGLTALVLLLGSWMVLRFVRD